MKAAHPKPEPRSTAALLTVQAIACRLGVSPKTVRRMIARGDLPVHYIGRLLRITESDLQTFIGIRRR